MDTFPTMDESSLPTRYTLPTNYWRNEPTKKDPSKSYLFFLSLLICRSISMSNTLLLDSLPSTYPVSHVNMYPQNTMSQPSSLPSMTPLNSLSMSNVPSLPSLPNLSIASTQSSQSINNSLSMNSSLQPVPVPSYSSQYQYTSLPVINPLLSNSINLQPILPSYKSSTNPKDPASGPADSLDYDHKVEENKNKTTSTDHLSLSMPQDPSLFPTLTQSKVFSLSSLPSDLPLLMHSTMKESAMEDTQTHSVDVSNGSAPSVQPEESTLPTTERQESYSIPSELPTSMVPATMMDSISTILPASLPSSMIPTTNLLSSTIPSELSNAAMNDAESPEQKEKLKEQQIVEGNDNREDHSEKVSL